ncbi:hypothetical protein GTW71_22880 [Streptomyces sp. SID6041]|nr:hypothetical protein [Streptomyces sp. SID6041]
MAPPTLPAPTGPHTVGATSMYLQDLSRPDPWVPDVSSRELMVSLWYPTAPVAARRAPYLTRTESAYAPAGARGPVAPALPATGPPRTPGPGTGRS